MFNNKFNDILAELDKIQQDLIIIKNQKLMKTLM